MGVKVDPPMVKILVIDDNEAFRTTICLWLKRNGYEVFEAGDGKAGIKQLQKQPVDLVLTDILMPEQDGLETIPTIKEIAPATKVIVMSGGMMDGRVDFLPVAIKLGADHALHKPFNGTDLLAAVKKVLNP